jgi:hypothetical protein
MAHEVEEEDSSMHEPSPREPSLKNTHMWYGKF